MPLPQRRLIQRLAEVIATAVTDAHEQDEALGRPGGMLIAGGDLTSAVLDVLGVQTFDIGEEMLPLTVHGVLGEVLDGVR